MALLRAAEWDSTLGDPVQPARTVLTLSASRIRDFQRCRRMFFMAHILRLPGDSSTDSDAAFVGSTTHEVLYDIHKLGTQVQDHKSSAVPGEEVYVDPRAESLIRSHINICPSENAEYLGGELDARWLIVRKQVLLTGRFDALWLYPDGVIEIRDYKTGRCPDSLDGDLGAAIYLLLAINTPHARTKRVHTVRVVYESLANPEGRTVTLNATKSLLREAYDEVTHMAKLIREEKSFPPNPSGSNCRTCAYRGTCPSSQSTSTD
jgi:RecB family exonuclease